MFILHLRISTKFDRSAIAYSTRRFADYCARQDKRQVPLARACDLPGTCIETWQCCWTSPNEVTQRNGRRSSSVVTILLMTSYRTIIGSDMSTPVSRSPSAANHLISGELEPPPAKDMLHVRLIRVPGSTVVADATHLGVATSTNTTWCSLPVYGGPVDVWLVEPWYRWLRRRLN